MTFPHWVTTAYEYVRWLDGVIEGSGGFLEQPCLMFEPFGVAEALGLGYEHTTVVDHHDLIFPGTGRLEFSIIVVEHLTLDEEPVGVSQAEYHYHFRTDDQPTMLWRYDKHPDHPGVGLCHVHRLGPSGHEVVEPHHEVDLDDVIRIIYRDHMK